MSNNTPEWLCRARLRRGRSKLSKAERKTRHTLTAIINSEGTFKARVGAWCTLNGVPRTKAERQPLREETGVNDNSARRIISQMAA